MTGDYFVLRPVSNVVLLPCLAGSTVARLQHDLVSDVEFKKESTRGSSNKWTKLCTEIVYIISQTSECATVLNIFSKEIISNNTKCRKQILKII